LTRAQFLIDEEEDDVKEMNKMLLFTKIVSIRDRQLEENKRISDEWYED
jgi:Trichohyalin-plectin-homology domain